MAGNDNDGPHRSFSRGSSPHHSFEEQLENELPGLRRRLRAYAYRLSRDTDEAEDLVQEALARALRFQETFQPGTNLPRWMMAIMRNQFISQRRRSRPTLSYDEDGLEELPVERPLQLVGLEFRDVLAQLERLPPKHRHALVRIAIDGIPYSQFAEESQEPIGTIKARVFRARVMLAELLDGSRERS